MTSTKTLTLLGQSKWKKMSECRLTETKTSKGFHGPTAEHIRILVVQPFVYFVQNGLE